MPACAVKRGIITLRDCGEEAVNSCSVCGRPVCAEHSRIESGSILCVECYAKQQASASATADSSSGKGGRASSRTGSAGTDEWDDPSYPFTYRHHYYSFYHYSPFYGGDYYDSYYDDYDVRSFDSTGQNELDGDGPDAGGFQDS